ncbi:MAG: M48 family metallopeptidase [Planctomycetota bacterium]|nr:M48 family metallopeptidase [Planctomycetota bacterium]
MTHLLVIGLVVAGALREIGPESLVNQAWVEAHPAGALAGALLPFLCVALVQIVTGWRCGRLVDRRGSVRAVRVFEKVSALVRLSTLLLQVSAVLVFGWLDIVRSWTGDLVAVDELIALVPAFGVMALTWATAGPIERRLREALLIRRLDEGLSIPPMPGALTWWWATVRQQLLFPALPVLLIMGFAEAVGIVRDGLWDRADVRDGWGVWGVTAPEWAARAPEWLLNRDVIVYGSVGMQLVGVVVMLALLPLALRVLWDTVPLGPGGLRDGLSGMCKRYGVRVRNILVWRTHGAMINGAVVGLLPRLRYIVLTDALLESLPGAQVEAVAAHELAHVKHRHMPWLALGLGGSAVFFGSAASMGARLAGFGSVTEGWWPVVLLLGVLGMSVLVFGWASRAFEWQADVFAAQHMTRRLEGEGAAVVGAAGARVMSQTLRAVALVNGFPPDRFTFRHGSIDGRRQRLMESVGEPIARGKADRAAGLVKRAVLLLLVVGVGLAVLETVAAGPETEQSPKRERRAEPAELAVNPATHAEPGLGGRPGEAEGTDSARARAPEARFGRFGQGAVLGFGHG